jgi:hypothetical protein
MEPCTPSGSWAVGSQAGAALGASKNSHYVRTGERIYHLPFDQQYDKTAIEPARGQCYAITCAEAEAMGFCRAWRWRGE